MKRFIALAVEIFGLRAIGVFAGEPISPAMTPPDYFSPNEFDIGAFGTYAMEVGSDNGASSIPGGRYGFYVLVPLKT